MLVPRTPLEIESVLALDGIVIAAVLFAKDENDLLAGRDFEILRLRVNSPYPADVQIIDRLPIETVSGAPSFLTPFVLVPGSGSASAPCIIAFNDAGVIRLVVLDIQTGGIRVVNPTPLEILPGIEFGAVDIYLYEGRVALFVENLRAGSIEIWESTEGTGRIEEPFVIMATIKPAPEDEFVISSTEGVRLRGAIIRAGNYVVYAQTRSVQRPFDNLARFIVSGDLMVNREIVDVIPPTDEAVGAVARSDIFVIARAGPGLEANEIFLYHNLGRSDITAISPESFVGPLKIDDVVLPTEGDFIDLSAIMRSDEAIIIIYSGFASLVGGHAEIFRDLIREEALDPPEIRFVGNHPVGPFGALELLNLENFPTIVDTNSGLMVDLNHLAFVTGRIHRSLDIALFTTRLDAEGGGRRLQHHLTREYCNRRSYGKPSYSFTSCAWNRRQSTLKEKA